MFSNGAEYAGLYPQDERTRWEFCLPRLEWGCQELTEIRAALLWRAEALGHDLERDTDLCLVVDGEMVRPLVLSACHYRFEIPDGCCEVLLASRCVVPAEVDAAWRDTR